MILRMYSLENPWRLFSDDDTGDESDKKVAKEESLEKNIEPHVRSITQSLLHDFNLVNCLWCIIIVSLLLISDLRSSLINRLLLILIIFPLNLFWGLSDSRKQPIAFLFSWINEFKNRAWPPKFSCLTKGIVTLM